MSRFAHLKGGVRFDQPTDPAFPPLAFARAGLVLPAIPDEGYLLLSDPQKQRRAGSCVPHGYGGCVESRAKLSGIDFQVSIQDWYFGGRYLEGNGAERRDGGTYPSLARRWAREYGLLGADRAPYDDSTVTTWRPKAEWAADRRLLGCEFDPLPVSRDSLLYELAVNRGLVPVCHAGTKGIDNVGADGMERFVPLDPNEKPWGHCRDLCGWNLRLLPEQGGCGLVWNWWDGFGIPHPRAHLDNRFELHRDSFSWISFRDLVNRAFVQDAARLATPPRLFP